jgi:serine/threonine protein kinase
MTRPLTAPGRLVAGRYRLQSQIGGGGMGAVWLARDELLGRKVAIKQVLSPPGVSAEEVDQQRQRALREGRIAARLSHPHAISVYDVALESGQPWLVMEYLPSRSLAAVLREDGVLRVDQAAQVGAQVADALAATHAAGIVHRDVKPANILIGEGGQVEGLVKITDFGISHARGDITLTLTGQITGTPAFLAPEVAQGRPMTEASDVFSLGATLYTCLEGTPPFGMEDNALGLLHRVAGGTIGPPRRSGSLTQPLQKMLAPDPAARPAMAEVRDELATLAAGRGGDTNKILVARTDLGSTSPARSHTSTFPAGAAETPAPVAPPHPEPPPLPPQRGRRRRRAPWVAAGLVALVLAGLITLWAAGPFGGDDGSAARGTSTGASSAASGPSGEYTSGAPTSASESTEPTAPSVDAESVRGRDVDKAVKDFFKLIPGDLEAAHQLTSPDFRNEFPLERFAGFWDEFRDVKVSNVQTQDGSTAATVDIEYVWPDGRRQTERHVLTFVVGDGGELLLDRDVVSG